MIETIHTLANYVIHSSDFIYKFADGHTIDSDNCDILIIKINNISRKLLHIHDHIFVQEEDHSSISSMKKDAPSKQESHIIPRSIAPSCDDFYKNKENFKIAEQLWMKITSRLHSEISHQKSISQEVGEQQSQFCAQFKKFYNDIVQKPLQKVTSEEVSYYFWQNPTFVEAYIKTQLAKLQLYKDTLLQRIAFISATIEAAEYDPSRSTLEEQRNINKILHEKVTVVSNLLQPIVHMYTRVVNEEYGTDIKDAIISASESIVTFEPFIRLLCVDICTQEDISPSVIGSFWVFKNSMCNAELIQRIKNIKKNNLFQLSNFISSSAEDPQTDFLRRICCKAVCCAYEFTTREQLYNDQIRIAEERIEQLQYSSGVVTFEEVFREISEEVVDVLEQMSFPAEENELNNFSDTYEEDVFNSDIHDPIFRQEESEYEEYETTPLPSLLVKVLQPLINPTQENILQQSQIVARMQSVDESYEFITHISSHNQRYLYALFIFIEKLIKDEVGCKKILFCIFKEWEKSVWPDIVRDCINALLNENSPPSILYRLAYTIYNIFEDDLKPESCTDLIAFMVKYINDKIADQIFTRSYSFQFSINAISLLATTDFLSHFQESHFWNRFIFDAVAAFEDHYEINSFKAYRKLQSSIDESKMTTAVKHSYQKEKEKIIEEYNEIYKEKAKVVHQLYSSMLSLHIHILQGEYGQKVKEWFLEISDSQRDQKLYFTFILIHQPSLVEKEGTVSIERDEFCQQRRHILSSIHTLSLQQVEALLSTQEMNNLYNNHATHFCTNLKKIESCVHRYNDKATKFIDTYSSTPSSSLYGPSSHKTNIATLFSLDSQKVQGGGSYASNTTTTTTTTIVNNTALFQNDDDKNRRVDEVQAAGASKQMTQEEEDEEENDKEKATMSGLKTSSYESYSLKEIESKRKQYGLHHTTNMFKSMVSYVNKSLIYNDDNRACHTKIMHHI